MPDQSMSRDDESPEQLVKDCIERRDFYFDALSAKFFKQMADDHKLWLGHREDRRKPNEKWRSWSQLGDPYRLTRIESDAWLEIMSSLDPPLQCEGRGGEDEAMARAFERFGEYMLTANRWTSSQEMLFRNLSIRGWQPMKTGWREIKYSPIARPSDEQRRQFDDQLNEAMKTGMVTEPPKTKDNPQEWQEWYDANRETYPYTPQNPSVPPLPEMEMLAPRPKDTVIYRGPWYDYPSPFTLTFDPFCEDRDEMDFICQRFTKVHSWTEERIEKGEFDPQAVKDAGTAAENSRLTEWDRQIAEKIGLSFNENDPGRKNVDEFFEVWRPLAKRNQYLVIMNRSRIVNRNTDHPFWHRGNPYHFILNVPVTGHPIGLGSYQQLRRTFEDRALFRDMLLNTVVLHGLGVYLKRRGMGLTDMQRMLTPGMIVDVADPEGFRSALGPMTGFAELMQIGQLLLGDQQSLSSTGENVAGATATVGRVSATEATARLTQALVPHKKKAERLEEEESGTLYQMYYNAYQKYPADLSELRQQIVGGDQQDPFANPQFTRETFAEVLRYNIRFRGATTKLNKELLAQQLKDFLATIAQIQSTAGIQLAVFTPGELRNIARRIFETFGQKGQEQIITVEGDQAVAEMVKAHLIAAQTAPIAAQTGRVQAEAGLQAAAQPPPPPQEPPPPTMRPSYKDAPPDVRRQIEQRDGFQPSQMPEPSPLEEKQMDMEAKAAQRQPQPPEEAPLAQ